jgi:hypothetical protein
MRGLHGFVTSTPLVRWETLKVSPKNPKGVTQDQIRDLRSDSEWSNQLSYRAILRNRYAKRDVGVTSYVQVC